MSNPILNEKALNEAARAGWAAPEGAPRSTPIGPMTDGPVSGWQSTSNTMTVSGTATATGVLLVLLLAAAGVGWSMTGSSLESKVQFPVLAIAAVFVGFGVAIFLRFKPMLAKFLAPIYALAEGFFVGVISAFYDARYHGIVVQAVGATLAVFAVMLFLYKTRIIKVTDRFRRNVIMATTGLMLFYGVSIIMSLFGVTVPFIHDASPIGILFSVFAAGLATMMLAVDFDMIERGAKAGWPKGMEWYCAFGLLATLIWLYLEILRLLAKLNRR
ncbi:MAG: Bax inhibitor-1/YccA family protein [Ilumatobacteraceae bacterium]